MSRKWIVAASALAAVGATAVAAASVLGGGAQLRPEHATVDVRLDRAAPASARPLARRTRKPKVLYLTGEATLDVATTGPYIDFKLTGPGCRRIVDGGVAATDTNVYQQGSYVAHKDEYHVLLGFDDEAVANGQVVNFTYRSHLICLKGVR